MQVVGMLVDGYSGSNTAQESAYRRLTELAQHAEFDLYLSYILTNGTPQEMKVESAIVRQSAGLLLKNNLRRSYKTLPPSSREFVHAELLTAVGDEISTIRSTTSLAVSVIVSEAGLRGTYVAVFSKRMAHDESNRSVMCVANNNSPICSPLIFPCPLAVLLGLYSFSCVI